MKILQVSELNKRYGSKRVLVDLSFTLEKSDFLLVLGDNGSGKTTLLKILSGLVKQDRGSVQFSDTRLSPKQFRKNISYTGTESFLYNEMTLIENLELFSKLLEIENKQMDSLVDRFSLKSFLNTRVSELSSGTLKKASLIRAFLGKPQLIILDEALNYLDDRGKENLLKLIQERKSDGASIVFATNRESELASYSDQVLRLGSVKEGT